MDRHKSILSKNKQMDLAHGSFCLSRVRSYVTYREEAFTWRAVEDSDQDLPIVYQWVVKWNSAGNIAVTCVRTQCWFCSWLYSVNVCVSVCVSACVHLNICKFSVYVSAYVCVQNVFFVFTTPAGNQWNTTIVEAIERSGKVFNKNAWREEEGRELEGEVAICCDEKKMGTLPLFYCSDCRRIPPR